MIVIRFKVQCRPEKADEAARVLGAVVGPSRGLDGVVSFDVARDVTDPNVFIATEVFEDRAALDRQEAQEEVGAAMTFFGDALTAPPEATIYHVSSSEPYE